jgi:hypothetical protein
MIASVIESRETSQDKESVRLWATVKEAVADVHTETPQEKSREAGPGPP